MPNPFTIETSEQGGIAIIVIDGYVDAHTAPQFENAIQSELDAGRYRIVVDCSRLNYISSAGLGVFMSFIEEVRELGGDIKISGLTSKVKHTFELLGFQDIFDMPDNQAQALDHFGSAATVA